MNDNSAFQNTDDAEIVTVLAATQHCADSWDGNARLLGNVRARDISRSCSAAIKAIAEIERLRSALETAAGRFNMMAGVGLVNGADPKVGYRECMEALQPIELSR